ncbi:phage tail length tape measure family protein [Comamonas koreensis]|uniref:Phage tail length tape measure family protein n=1 Tax=Comamonas koreensis TaxID=160825 RepID=A0AAW4XT39_9BURK|nr:phage tail length tape measure family protein [Comamonas koreensis]MCD2164280.1 phage tail length tape measure family protein [Comamonas koreensis]
MADLTKNINVGVDASGVKTGLQEATKSIKDFGKTVQDESNKGAGGVDRLGESVKKLGPTTDSSMKVSERAFKGWSSEVTRAATQIQAAGDKVKEFELKAQLKGFTPDMYKPQIEALRGVIAEQDRLRASNANLGMSAAATAAALRNVPAQFTDIVVSLQAGQAPLTVLLQQGGQLKDMFGGAGNAAKALGGYVLSLVSPFTLLAAGAAAVAAAYAMGAKENDAFVRAMVLSGNATGTTRTQLREYAREIDGVVGTQAQAAEGLAAFVAAGVQGSNNLRQFTQTAIEWEKATGQAVEDTAKQFADLQKDPLAAVVKLNEGMNFLTSSVYDQIKSLDDQGRSAEAAQVAMNALDSAMRERGQNIKNNLGYIERGWNGIKNAAKEAWDAMLNVGRAATLNDRLGDVRKELNSLMNQQSWGETGGGAATGRVTAETKKRIQERIEALRAEEWQLEATSAAEQLNAVAKEASAKATQNAVSWSQLYDKHKAKEVQRSEELAQASERYKERLKDATLTEKERNRISEEYVQIQRDIEDKYADKKGAGRSKQMNAENREMERQTKLIGELAGLSSTFYKDWDSLSMAFKSGVIKNVQDLEKEQAKLLAKQPFMIAQAKEEAEALREKQKALDAERRAQEAITNARLSAANAVSGNVQKLKDDIAAARMAYSQNISLALALEMVTLARAEETLALEKLKENNEANVFILEAEIEKRKELIGLLGEKETFDNFTRSAADATNEARRMMDDVGNALANSLMDGGKSAAEYIKGLLRALFIKPFVMNIVASVFGLSSGAAAAGAAASGGGMFSNLSSGLSGANALGLLGTFGGGMSAGFGGLMGSLGLSTTGATFGGAMSAGTIAMGSGNILGGLGTFLGALGPIIGGLGLLFGGDIFGSLFGRKLKESGVEGTFGGDSGFEGRLFKYYKGGLFRSNKTTYEELPEEMRSALGNQFLAMDESIRAMAGAVGLGGEALDGFTARIKVNLKGLSEEEATKKLQEEFQKIADQMGGLVLTTDEYTRAGETQLEALTRLSTSITLANEWFKAIGDTLYSVSLAGADMASELMDAFGGADKFAAATSNYYDKFYTDQEKVANQTRLLNEALKKLGVESMPTSRDALREYINGIDLSTEAGRKLYAAMIGLADSFDVVYTSAENIAAMKEDLNVQLLRAQGKDDEATKLERAKQLKELEKYKDPELVRMQVEVWNAEDKAKSDAAAKQAAEDLAAEMAAAQKAAKDLAMKNLEAAVSREKEYWNQFSADAKDALTKASSYFDLVTNAAKSLRDSIEDSASWSAAAGMVYIEQALDRARKGGGLSDLDATKSAIEAATGGLVMDNYATQAELDYDKKVLAGQLDELGGYAELAKSDAQKQIDLANAQIKRLDDTLTFWKEYGEEQVDATMSVTDAVNALYKLLDPKEQERIRKEEAAKAGVGGGSAPGYTPTGGGSLGGTVAGSNRVTVVGLTADGRAIFSNGEVGKYAAGEHAYNSTGAMVSNGYSLAEFERFKTSGEFEWDPATGQWRKRASFAIGTNYVPRDMTANIHEGERIIPAADNRALMAALNTQGGGNAELVQEVKALRAELQAINANTAAGAEYGRRTSSDISQVTEGGNAMRVANMA